MIDQRDRAPHGGLRQAMDYVVDRLALASEVETTAEVSERETAELFVRHLMLLRYERREES